MWWDKPVIPATQGSTNDRAMNPVLQKKKKKIPNDETPPIFQYF
jgi:hypothetical protein